MKKDLKKQVGMASKNSRNEILREINLRDYIESNDDIIIFIDDLIDAFDYTIAKDITCVTLERQAIILLSAAISYIMKNTDNDFCGLLDITKMFVKVDENKDCDFSDTKLGIGIKRYLAENDDDFIKKQYHSFRMLSKQNQNTVINYIIGLLYYIY